MSGDGTNGRQASDPASWFLTDTHAHLDRLAASGAWPAALERARSAGVKRIVAVGGSPDSNRTAVAAAQASPGSVRAAVGLDRDQVGGPLDFASLRALAADPAVAALGETGLDYHYDAATAAAQRACMERHLDLAQERKLPVIVHSREAEEDTLSLLRACRGQRPPPSTPWGVLHCFTGSPAFAEALIELDFMISFSGIITFKNAEPLRAIAARLPEDRILLETDTPYLAPEPCRGKTNEPALLLHVLRALATVRNAPADVLAARTSLNAERLFGAWA